jgi:cleavage and polyadenylation specificity factor subunit 3
MSVTINSNNLKREGERIEISGPNDVLEIMPVGAGNEVGRSCVLLSYKGRKVLVRCEMCLISL